jgi:hypothetical protein
MKRNESRNSGLFTLVGTLIALTGITSLVACNDHVFTVIEPICHAEELALAELDVGKPVDILIVVDNSGSMCEEQTALKQSFLDPNCPIQDLNNPPEADINPSPERVRELSENCGFIQILSLFEATDFRLGVITTDVSACDNSLQQANLDQFLPFNCFGQTFPNRGRHPQRGCLQPPDINGGPRYLQLGDQDIDVKFSNILDNVQTWGSGFERGLDATVSFLQGDVADASCANDVEDFIRDDARLAVIYLTDEDDCSHSVNDAFGDENVNITCNEGVQETFVGNAGNCYNVDNDPDVADAFTNVSVYVDFLQQFKGSAGDVKVAVIGGAVEEPGGLRVAQGCSNVNNVPSGACTPSLGASNIPSRCGPDGEVQNCCEADGSTRYFDFADQFGQNGFVNSICTDFRSTMIGIAEFIGRVEDIVLKRPPPNPNEIIIRVTRNGENEPEFLSRIPDDEPNPDTQDGFQYDGNVTIRFFGGSAPQPGDQVSVHYASQAPGEPCDGSAAEE